MLPTPKTVVAFSASTTNAATASGNIDTLGFDHCVVHMIETAADAATNNMSVLKISEADTTDATNFADVTGLVGDTAFTIANAPTSGTQVAVQMRIDCRGRKRYLKLSASPITTQVLTGVATLYRGEEAPTAAGTGTLQSGSAVLVEL